MHWTLQTAAWVASPVLETTNATVMFRRGLWRQYPIFWSYLVAEIVRTALLFSIGNDPPHYAVYFYVYWVTETLVCLYGFFVVAEVFRQAFSMQLGLQQWGMGLFRASLLLLIAFAVLAAAAAHGNEPSKLVAGILVLKRVESLVRLGLVIALFVFVAVIGLAWNSYMIGIATGFAIYGVAEFCGMTIRFEYGRSTKEFLTWVLMAGAICENLVWMAYFVLPRKGRDDKPSVAVLDRSTAVAELAEAGEALQSLLK